jgi:hypothetical protein
MIKASEHTLPIGPKRINGNVKYSTDAILNGHCEKQRRLTASIYKSGKKWNGKKRKTLKRRRNKVFEEIRERLKTLERQNLEQLATDFDQSNRAAFKFA